MASQLLAVGAVIEATPAGSDQRRFRKICQKFAEVEHWQGDYKNVPVDLVYERTDAFRVQLRDRLTKSNSEFKSYSDFIPDLFEQAQLLGWAPDQNLSDAWRGILDEEKRRAQAAVSRETKPRPSCIELVRYFARLQREPQDVTHQAVELWIDNAVISGDRTYLSAYLAARRFEGLLLCKKYNNVNPLLALRSKNYGIRLENFPPALQKEVQRLLDFRTEDPHTWKSQEQSSDNEADEAENDDELDDAEGAEPEQSSDEELDETENDGELGDAEDAEPEQSEEEPTKLTRRRQVRQGTADGLEKCIGLLYGFLMGHDKDKDKRESITSLRQLFTRRAFKAYLKFLKKDRLGSPKSIRATFTMLIGSARQYDPLAGQTWYGSFLRTIEDETEEEERTRRRERACRCTYEELERIPATIDQEIARIRGIRVSSERGGFYSKSGVARRIARLEMERFLIQWMLVLPWPPTNICQCRIDGENPNLFERPIDPEDQLMLPPWAEKAYRSNPKKEFWQFSFSDKETSNGVPVHAVLPQCLINPLENYRDHSRRVLLAKDPLNEELGLEKCETLFLTKNKEPFRAGSVLDLFSSVTLRFAQARVSPQVFRDIWAFEYLLCRPKDYFGLALNLWQYDENVTKRLFGSDEEDWVTDAQFQ